VLLLLLLLLLLLPVLLLLLLSGVKPNSVLLASPSNSIALPPGDSTSTAPCALLNPVALNPEDELLSSPPATSAILLALLLLQLLLLLPGVLLLSLGPNREAASTIACSARVPDASNSTVSQQQRNKPSSTLSSQAVKAEVVWADTNAAAADASHSRLPAGLSPKVRPAHIVKTK
jgi:hypothetical protein